MQVQLDLDYRKEWDSMCVDLNVFDSEPLTRSDLIYWELRWPVIIKYFLRIKLKKFLYYLLDYINEFFKRKIKISLKFTFYNDKVIIIINTIIF